MKNFAYLITLSFLCLIVVAQPPDSSTAKSEKIRHPNIIIQTLDGMNYKGRVVQIGADYVLMDAIPYNSAAALRPYYLRAEGDYHRIDVNYIKTATISKGRSIGMSTLTGALAGGIIMGILGYFTGFNSEDYDALTGLAYGTLIGVSMGTTAGFVSGLFHHKKINIEGSSTALAKLTAYYF